MVNAKQYHIHDPQTVPEVYARVSLAVADTGDDTAPNSICICSPSHVMAASGVFTAR